MKDIKVLLAISFFTIFSCKESPKIETTFKEINTQFATSQNGMVAAAQPLATRAGLEILEAGGNAADAALATAFVIAVVEPSMNGIGGRNLILVHKHNGDFQGYNGMTEIPKSFVPSEIPANSGHETIATPGVVASLMRLYKEHGTLPLPQIMAASIKHATEGFKVLPGEAARHLIALDAIKNDPGFKNQMLKDSITYDAGEILKQPDLAHTLKRIADTEGKDFYEGEIAKKIASDMQANGGFVSVEDLKNYKATDMRYVSTKYRGYDIHTMPAPSGGGLLVKTLNILEQFDLDPDTIDDTQWALLMNQALSISMNTLKTDYHESNLELVQSKEWAKEQAKSIIVPHLKNTETAYDFTQGKKSKLLADNTDWSGSTWGNDSHHTTHFVTSDCKGMVVSITQTVGPLFGSKVITPGLGFVYASTMGAYLSASDQSPGSRPRTTIAPTIVTKDGKTVMVLGAAGGFRILSGIAQTISRHIDRKLDIKQAVSAPRIHPEATIIKDTGEKTYDGINFSAEYTPNNGWTAKDSLIWQKEGFKITPIIRYGAFSRVHALTFDTETNTWTGVADPDWEGTALGPKKSDCEF